MGAKYQNELDEVKKHATMCASFSVFMRSTSLSDARLYHVHVILSSSHPCMIDVHMMLQIKTAPQLRFHYSSVSWMHVFNDVRRALYIFEEIIDWSMLSYVSHGFGRLSAMQGLWPRSFLSSPYLLWLCSLLNMHTCTCILSSYAHVCTRISVCITMRQATAVICNACAPRTKVRNSTDINIFLFKL